MPSVTRGGLTDITNRQWSTSSGKPRILGLGAPKAHLASDGSATAATSTMLKRSRSQPHQRAVFNAPEGAVEDPFIALMGECPVNTHKVAVAISVISGEIEEEPTVDTKPPGNDASPTDPALKTALDSLNGLDESDAPNPYLVFESGQFKRLRDQKPGGAWKSFWSAFPVPWQSRESKQAWCALRDILVQAGKADEGTPARGIIDRYVNGPRNIKKALVTKMLGELEQLNSGASESGIEGYEVEASPENPVASSATELPPQLLNEDTELELATLPTGNQMRIQGKRKYVLGDKVYSVDRMLGMGKSGHVYKIVDDAGRSYALKIKSTPITDDNFASHMREARFMQQFSEHPHLCGIFGAYKIGDGIGFLMPLRGQQTLFERLRKGSFSAEQIRALSSQLISVFQFATKLGIEINDCNLENITVSEDSEGKLHLCVIDYESWLQGGKGLGYGEAYSQNVTFRHGKPGFVSPEFFDEAAAYLAEGGDLRGESVASINIWPLSVLLYAIQEGETLATGEIDHEGATRAIVEQIGERYQDSSDPNKRLIAAGISRDPSQRPTVEQMAEAFRPTVDSR